MKININRNLVTLVIFLFSFFCLKPVYAENNYEKETATNTKVVKSVLEIEQSTKGSSGEKIAVLIGVADYMDNVAWPDGVNDLLGPRNDTLAMKYELEKEGYTVHRYNDPTLAETLSGIRSAIDSSNGDGTFLFQYSGHGASGTGSLCLADIWSGGYLSPTELETELSRYGGTKVVLIDSCFSGQFIEKDIQDPNEITEEAGNNSNLEAFNQNFISAFENVDDQFTTNANLNRGGYKVLTASTGYETSADIGLPLSYFLLDRPIASILNFETGNGRKGFGGFTLSYLVGVGIFENPIYGSILADSNDDNIVTLSEMYSWVQYYANTNMGLSQAVQCYPENDSFVLSGSANVAPTYAVEYNGNGNTGGTALTDSNSPYDENSQVTLLGAGSLINTGYVFNGWNTESNGSGTHYDVGGTFNISGNLTLYAEWVQVFNVTYDANGATSGSAPTDENSPYNSGAAVTILGEGTLERTGYRFIGWNTEDYGSGTYFSENDEFTITDNIVLYAQWGEVNSEADFVYATNSDGLSCTITDYVGTRDDVIIPDTIEGLSVTSIGDSAFFDNSIKSINIPYGITTIGGSAFEQNELTSVNIPDSVLEIGHFAFTNNNLISVDLGKGIKRIDVYAFYNNSMTGVEIPDSMEFIGRGAFENNSFDYFMLPGSKQWNEFGTDYFGGFIRAGIVSGGDTVRVFNGYSLCDYEYIDNGDGTCSITLNYSAKKDVVIPSTIDGLTVISICEDAFLENELTSVVIPNSVTKIEKWSFPYNSLTNINIPNSVTYIGVKAFKDNQFTSFTLPSGSKNWRKFDDNNLDQGFAHGGDSVSVDFGYEVIQGFSVTYNGNGNTNGSIPIDENSDYNPGEVVTLLDNSGSLEKTDYLFIGWNTAEDGTGIHYNANDTFAITANVIIYAEWLSDDCDVNSDGIIDMLDIVEVAMNYNGVSEKCDLNDDGIVNIYDLVYLAKYLNKNA